MRFRRFPALAFSSPSPSFAALGFADEAAFWKAIHDKVVQPRAITCAEDAEALFVAFHSLDPSSGRIDLGVLKTALARLVDFGWLATLPRSTPPPGVPAIGVAPPAVPAPAVPVPLAVVGGVPLVVPLPAAVPVPPATLPPSSSPATTSSQPRPPPTNLEQRRARKRRVANTKVQCRHDGCSKTLNLSSRSKHEKRQRKHKGCPPDCGKCLTLFFGGAAMPMSVGVGVGLGVPSTGV